MPFLNLDPNLVGKFLFAEYDPLMNSTKYYKILKITPCYVWIKLYDSPYSEPKKISHNTFEKMAKRGIYEKVGLYSFSLASNKANQMIRHCDSNPTSAGEELYRLRLLENLVDYKWDYDKQKWVK